MKPQDFLIGIRDFFAILVPGAVVILLIDPKMPATPPLATEAVRFVAFTIAAFLIGSVADRLGALLDHLIDPVLRSKWLARIGPRMAAREREATTCRKQLLDSYFPEKTPFRPEDQVSTRSFWWDYLRLNCPPAIQELDRIEATQKLFRSLTAAFLFLALYYARASDAPAPHWFADAGAQLAWWMLLFGAASAILYAIGRFIFRETVFRLAVAYCVPNPHTSVRGLGS